MSPLPGNDCSSTRSPAGGVWLCLLLATLLAGCDTLGYYGQAIGGQVRILGQRQKIDRLLAAPDTDPALKARLQEIQAIRAFAATELQLPLDSQYSTYVDLQRPFVVWNVFAAPEFSLQPLSWCYPVAGCVSYRGYFSESAARKFAAGLQAQGFDVHVGGVAAYSTLGWFSDPVPSTIMNRETHQLASLLFHELAHHVAYAPGDTEFNESFATAVEQEGLQRWLQQSGIDMETQSELLRTAVRDRERQQQFVALVQAAAAGLGELYQSGAEEAALRSGKEMRLEQLRTDYANLKAQWGGYSGYDAWFSGDLNNARLGTVATYNNLVPDFAALLAANGGDLAGFYANVKDLERLDSVERRQRLRQQPL